MSIEGEVKDKVSIEDEYMKVKTEWYRDFLL